MAAVVWTQAGRAQAGASEVLATEAVTPTTEALEGGALEVVPSAATEVEPVTAEAPAEVEAPVAAAVEAPVAPPAKVIEMADLEAAVGGCGDAKTPAEFSSCLSAGLTKRGYEITPAATKAEPEVAAEARATEAASADAVAPKAEPEAEAGAPAVEPTEPAAETEPTAEAA